jgi:hypothetical protein
MNEFYKNKVSLPREARNAPDLRESIRCYVTQRLLSVADTCLMHDDDPFRREFGHIHRRYANFLLVVSEAIQDTDYFTKSVITWIEEDFNNAVTGAQREAAGIVGAELTKIVEIYQ